MKDNDIVYAKREFSTERSGTFHQGKHYRVCDMQDGYIVNGEWFSKKQFQNFFIPVIDVVLSEWKTLGLIQPNGKPCTKKAFKEKATVINWSVAKGRVMRVAYFYIDPSKLIYSFQPRYCNDNKKQVLDDAYDILCRCIQGEVYEFFDELPAVDRGNAGLPSLYGNMGRVRYQKTPEDMIVY